jgi:hypothetical protein
MSRSITNKAKRTGDIDMGCDIHIVVVKKKGRGCEILWDPGEFWRDENRSQAEYDEHWRKSRLAQSRNYERFAKLSGVRGDGPEANGWPDWASDHVDMSDEDLHSHTHYPIRQAAKIFLATEHKDTDKAALAEINPIAMYFNINPDEHDLSKVYVLISYDN